MAETPSPTLPPATSTEPTVVVIRPYPKVVFLYLTWVASLVCGLIQPISMGVETADLSATLGRIWLGIFAFNLLVISFEFSRIRSVAIVFFIIAFIFAGMQFGFLRPFASFLGGLDLRMNKVFYYSVTVLFSVIYLLVFITSRFNYWEIQPNEILHHHGFLGDVQRYPTRGMRMKKEITDVMEFVLLRSGTIVLDPPGEERPILLENIIGLNRVEEKIERLLGTLKVRLDEGRIGGTD
jgi:hypothetical protein